MIRGYNFASHFKPITIGVKNNMLTIIEETQRTGVNNDRMVRCLCECGKQTIIKLISFKNGHIKSCGCLLGIKRTEKADVMGLSRSRIYHIWKNMFQRCYNPKTPYFKNYGYRGIIICQEWHTFKSFYEWAMDNGYNKTLTIERIDNNKSYFPENCKWATHKEQNQNRRDNVYFTNNGVTLCIQEWATILGVSRKKIAYNIKRKTLKEIEILFSELKQKKDIHWDS
jgi:hypothetical protein